MHENIQNTCTAVAFSEIEVTITAFGNPIADSSKSLKPDIAPQNLNRHWTANPLAVLFLKQVVTHRPKQYPRG